MLKKEKVASVGFQDVGFRRRHERASIQEG